MYEPFVLDPAVHVPRPGLDVELFPDFVQGNIGVYRADQLFLKKHLVAAGIRADFAYPPARRTWLRQKSAGQLIMSIAVGLGTSGAVGLAQYLLAKRKPTDQVSLRVTRARKSRGRKMWDPETVELSGTAAEIARLLAEMDDSDDTP